MVVYWHLPLFAAMKAVTQVVKMFKENGTTEQLKDDLFTYSEYEDMMQLSKWLEIDGKYGEKEGVLSRPPLTALSFHSANSYLLIYGRTGYARLNTR